MDKKIAILGASYLQRPLIEECKLLGIETHVFAWKKGNIIEDIADYSYDISILNKEEILERCKQINIDGIITIGSDIAMPTVNYIANKLKLIGNSLECTEISTNKFKMREAFIKGGIPCPKFIRATKEVLDYSDLKIPVIVKPTDSSGSRGVTKVTNKADLPYAVRKALKLSIKGEVIIEEFVEGKEYSVEGISYKGKHEICAITDKTTTGAPYFVEIAHHQPTSLNKNEIKKIKELTIKTLKSLDIKNGASHTEILIKENGEMIVVESAGRMGGEWIGSHITPYSTGFNYVRAVILTALGEDYQGKCFLNKKYKYSGVYYVTPKAGKVKRISKGEKDKTIKDYHIMISEGEIITDLDGADKRAAIIFYAGTKNTTREVCENFINYHIE